MNLIELQKTLRAVEPAAVLVPPRALENIVKQSWNLSGYWTVPHQTNFIIDRPTLFRHVDQEDLVLGPDELLQSATVILLAMPSSDVVLNEPNDSLLLKYWQELFHASVHLILENLWSDGKLTPAELRARIGAIGPAQFEEIKDVLVHDDYLPAQPSDRMVYTEFVARFLEEYYFTAGLLEATFPGIQDREAMRQLLERDVDGATLMQRTRLAGAADPVVQTVTTSQEAHEYYYKLIGSSERANKAGNVVLAAIQKRRAARVAPPDMAADTMKSAQADMLNLAQRLKSALDLGDERVAEWHLDLLTLLDKADQGARPAEAALLYDLQKVCLDNEQDIYALDLVEWLLSLGRRPVKRPLPSQRLVRLTRHLRSATQRLTMARLSNQDRRHLEELLQTAQQNCETRLRERFRPVFASALEDVGLKPRNPPERVAFDKMIEELIDRIAVFGFLTFSDLRDTLSRNLLKLPDLREPEDFILGDPLLRLDRRLSTLLDGVYRRGEFYLRWLERFTAFNFGTKVGRLLTQYVTLPFGSAFLLIAAFLLVVGLGQDVYHFFRPSAEDEAPDLVERLQSCIWVMAPLGLFILALVHSPKLRERTTTIALAVIWPLHATLVQGPIWLIKNPALRNLAKTSSFQLFYWWVFKPLVLTGILRLLPLFKDAVTAEPWWVFWLLAFGASNFVVNSRPGRAFAEGMSYTLAHLLEQVRAGLLPALVSFIVALFKNVVHFIEAMLFYVDEWLHLRKGDGEASMVLRGLLTLIWFPVSYLIRFNMVVLIEPCLNPLKLPVCSIAFKLWLPFYYVIPTYFAQFGIVAEAIGYWLTFWFADVFGFFFWEIKENWSLYRANRSPVLKPMVVGPKGETLPRLLRPGFNSGTVPKLYARLRQAERDAYQTGNWSAVRSTRAALDEVARTVRLFLVRDFVGLLSQDFHWKGQGLGVGKVHLATNRIRVELHHPRHADAPAVLEFENRCGWLVAGFASVGWLEQLPADLLPPLHNALITLYKLAGVDLVSEQLQALFPTQAKAADLTSEGLEFRIDGRPGPAVVYDLQTPAESIAPQLAEGVAPDGWPVLSDRQILLQQVPVTWEECVHSWQSDISEPNGTVLAADVALMPWLKLQGAAMALPKQMEKIDN